jgi:hypothetical protein
MLVTEAGIAREAEAMQQLVQTAIGNRCNSNREISRALTAKYGRYVAPSTIGRIRKHDPNTTKWLADDLDEARADARKATEKESTT